MKPVVTGQRLPSLESYLSEAATRQRFVVIGKGKSGTTWLAKMFTRHPAVSFVGERRLLDRPRGGAALLEPLLDERRFQRWFRSSSFGLTLPEDSEVRFELARIIADTLRYRVYAAKRPAQLRRVGQKTHLGEKIAISRVAEVPLVLGNLDRIYPEIQILHIVRDPRDMAISALFHHARHAAERGRRGPLTAYTRALGKGRRPGIIPRKARSFYCFYQCLHWRRINAALTQVGRARYGERYHRLRYEDLHEDCAGTFAGLANAIGLSCSQAELRRILERTSFKALSGGRQRGEEQVQSFFRKGEVGDWRNHLGATESALCLRIAGNQCHELGYR